MEYCSGGELFDHIVEKNRLTESESRMFFRQIVSAVAYLHSLGYAHRDLKPENILLDKHQNLKLIDFGLCAKPEGGMENPLSTSCGSPTYAAPELVLGKQYLGTEVDIWAMGVLLYTLLVGALPFDDDSIDGLYKKILTGKYEEPPFLSKGSSSLIKSMLQVDPKKRITITELLSHPWLTLGILDPVELKSENVKCYDAQCVELMASQNHVHKDVMWNHLKKWKYDYHTATYLLLLSKKNRGSTLKLNNSSMTIPIEATKEISLTKTISKNIANVPDNFLVENAEKESKSEKNDIILNTPIDKLLPGGSSTVSTPDKYKQHQPNGFLEPNKPSSIRRPLKRLRSPGPDDGSPIPAKRAPTERSTPVNTPDKILSNNTSETPGSARRVLGSIERSFHRVVNVLTPKKNEDSTISRPMVLTGKNLCNISTTQYRDPELVISDLSKALEKKGVVCKRKGFTLRGKLDANVIQNLGACSFELEICYIPNLGPPLPKFSNTPTKSILKKGPLNFDSPVQKSLLVGDNKGDKCDVSKNGPPSAVIGIRRKRLKGDAWCYKKVCEEVLALTANEVKGVTESSV
ncbi:maternal embryonic leucine zipper kinase isoform X2 [Leptinotarsa decemlineata]